MMMKGGGRFSLSSKSMMSAYLWNFQISLASLSTLVMVSLGKEAGKTRNNGNNTCTLDLLEFVAAEFFGFFFLVLLTQKFTYLKNYETQYLFINCKVNPQINVPMNLWKINNSQKLSLTNFNDFKYLRDNGHSIYWGKSTFFNKLIK